MSDIREYVVSYEETFVIRSRVSVDIDEVKEWMAESGCGPSELVEDHVAEFLQSGEDPWDDLNEVAYDQDGRGDYKNLTVLEEI